MASRLGILRNALEPITLSRSPIRSLPWRSLSTGAAEEQDSSSSSDPFLHPPGEGLIFGRLTGTGKNTLKTDVIHYFEGCNLTAEDIKVEYNKIYNSVGMIMQFHSRSAFDMALRQIIRKGRLYNLSRVDRVQWDILTSYDGKTVLLQGIPRNALAEDIERLLCGCNFNAAATQIFLRPGFPDPIKMALIHFPTRNEAMNAFRMKNRSFCINNPIPMRVLQ